MSSPGWVRWLLRRVVDRGWAEDVIGDLEEVHAGRRTRRGAPVAWLLTSIEGAGLAVTLGVPRLRWLVRGTWLTAPELLLAFRQVGRTPVVTFTSVLALSVGIGLAAAGFAVVDALLHPELPFPGGDRFVEIRLRDAEERTERALEPGLYEVLSDETPVLEHLGAYLPTRVNIAYDGGGIELVPATMITPSTLRFLPYAPVAGRALLPSDGSSGAAPVVAITEGLWERRFGRDPDVIGRHLSVGGADATVVGVLPGDAAFPYRSDVWLPMPAGVLDGGSAVSGGAALIGVMATGASVAAVQTRLAAVVAAWSAERPADAMLAEVRHVGEIRGAGLPGLVFIAAFIGLLVVVAGNVANLVIARTAARRSELAVRTALGASRGRLVAQLSAEVLVAGFVASVLGLWASSSLLGAIASGEADEIPVWIDLGLTFGRAAFAVGLMGIATLVAGVVPALRATRRDVAVELRGGRGEAKRAFGKFDDAMIIAQIALSIGVLGAASMLHQGWIDAYGGNAPGFRADEMVSAHVTLVGDTGIPADSAAHLRAQVEAAVAELPGVVAVGTSTRLPWTDGPLRPVEVEGLQLAGSVTPRVPTVAVGAGLLEMLDAAPLAGRLFRGSDFAAGAPPVAVVNQPFVDRWLGGANAIGRRIRFDPAPDGSAVWFEIVGVVPDRGLSAADPELAGGVYVPLCDESDFRLLARTVGRPADLLPALQAATFAVDPRIAVEGTGVLSRQLSEIRRVFMVFGSIFTSLGGVVLLLSMMATFAILSFEVTRRTREIGVRVALGANAPDILRQVVGRAAVYMLVGGVLGTGLGFLLLAGARATLVMRFPPTGPGTFPLLVLVTSVAALMAAWLPARRVLAIRPMDALRSD